MTTLSLDQAQRIVSAALQASNKAGYQPMGVAVLDAAGQLISFAREDGASMFRFDIARAKAFYSAALAPLGYSVCFEGNFGSNILGFA